MNKKVTLFIVGAAKSGTSSLWQYLKAHPDVFMPEDELHKEPCFFSSYGEHMGMENYSNIFSPASNGCKIIGEASTAYLTDPLSAKRIYEYNPHAKIVIMLRNPAERAYSLYNWMVQDGYEFASTFQEALDLESSRSTKAIPNWFEPQYYWNYMYFQSGLYCEQARRFLDLFGEKVMIIKFEQFRLDAESECNRVCYFLGIEPVGIQPIIYNPSRRVMSPKIQFILRKIVDDFNQTGKLLLIAKKKWHVERLYHEYAQQLSTVTQFTLKEKIMGSYVSHRINSFLKRTIFLNEPIKTKKGRDQLFQLAFNSRRPRPLDSRLRTQLSARYRRDIDRLSALTNIDFSDWYTA